MLAWLKNVLRSRYVRLLEDELARERAENERVRAENRALLNSLLSTAGCPPVEYQPAREPREIPRLRRRSWHQLAAVREVEEARKARAQEEARKPPPA